MLRFSNVIFHQRSLSLRHYAKIVNSKASQKLENEASIEHTQPSEASQEIHPDLAVIIPARKEPTRPPFAKNLYLGNFDTAILEFPEIQTNDTLAELQSLVDTVERYFRECVDSSAIDQEAKIPPMVLDDLKKMGLFGQQIPINYGGLGLNNTQYARLAEVTSMDASIAVTLAAHQAIGLKGILIAGTEEQKQKYLPRLASGEHIAAFCLTEPSTGSDAAAVQTKATLSEDGSHYLLNGSKLFISNGGLADVFTVFARTESTGPDGEKRDNVTAFIVERAFGGVTNGQPEDKLGIRGSNTCELFFDNTPVPLENVLGEVGHGFKLAVTILNSGRFSMGSSVAGELKRLMEIAAEHAISRSQFGKKLMEFGLIQEKFAKISVTIYAMESMAYMTAALMDDPERPDASIEAAMVKVFSSEGSWTCASELLQVMGGLGYMKSSPFERCVRDSRITQIFEGTNEVLRLFIALSGAQFAGRELKQLVKKLKDPLNNLGVAYSRIFKPLFSSPKNPKLRQKLYDHIHPLLGHEAEEFERRIYIFQNVIERYLSDYRNAIVEEQMSLKRFADITIDLYAICATLSRATRSKAIGLKNCDHEIMLAQTFCSEAIKRIDDRIEELNKGKHKNGDERYRLIAEAVFKNKGYAAEHPLTRNW